jgi:hypothetical protein
MMMLGSRSPSGPGSSVSSCVPEDLLGFFVVVFCGKCPFAAQVFAFSFTPGGASCIDFFFLVDFVVSPRIRRRTHFF